MESLNRRLACLLLSSLLAAACTSSSSGGGGAASTPAGAEDGDDEDTEDDEATSDAGAPTISAITFSPAPDRDHPNKDEAITATATATDPAGEGVLVDWKWFINGEEVPGLFGDTLSPGSYKKGDKIEAEATPRNTSGATGKPVKKGLTVGNLPPNITSAPTAALDGYKIEATDPDGDALTFEIEAPVPAGFSIADGTLKVTAEGRKAAAGKKVAILAKDTQGAFSRQEFEVPAAP